MLSIRSAMPLAISATFLLQSVCFALSSTDVVSAINSAQILDPGVGINARIDGDKVTVSTYRNPKNNDRDCKIDAVEIAKAVFDSSKGAVSRVTVCFYGKDLSQYQEVAVTAGDLKAFATGQTGQEQLLSSLEVHTQKVSSGAERVNNSLLSTTYGGNYRVSQRSDDELMITTPMGPWVTDEECKLDGLKLASVAANDLPDGVQRITVAFTDPYNRADTRLVTFAAAGLIDAWKTVQHALSVFPMSKQAPAIDIQSMQASAGPAKDDRDAVLQRIKGLASRGVGVTAFAKYFQQIDDMARKGDEAAVKAAVAHLNASLDDQEKASKTAKEADNKHTVSESAPDKFQGDVKGVGGRWGIIPKKQVEPEEVLADPEGYIKKHMPEVPAARQRALIDIVVRILQVNGKSEQAAAIQARGVPR